MPSTLARLTMLAGVARALVSRGSPRVAARQFRTSQPLRMAASTLEGLRNVAIVASTASRRAKDLCWMIRRLSMC